MTTIHPRLLALLEELARAFEKKFGRPPRDSDPVLFDPDSDLPVPYHEAKLTDEMAVAMDQVGSPPSLIWVFVRTGLIPSAHNQPS